MEPENDDYDLWLEATREGSIDYGYLDNYRTCANCVYWVSGMCYCGLSDNLRRSTSSNDQCICFDDIQTILG